MPAERSKYADEIALITALLPFLDDNKRQLAGKILRLLRMMEMMEEETDNV